ncbi:MAG: hypothetical protein ABIH66_07825, partial [bacterium]
MVFIEGADLKLLRRFAKVLGLDDVADGTNLVPFPLGGFRDSQHVKAVCIGIDKTVGVPISFAAMFDRDFRCSEEAQ